ncbi:hypothetical protein OAN13_06425 [Opitutales bacterium]|jgi:hypothetical protein|nr:hypothetical protein [Opitutales bacterium]
MDPLTIIAIIIGLLFAGFLFFVEEAFEKILNPLFRLVGLNSSCGPLEIRAEKKDESIILVIKNLGKSHASLASIQGRNANGKTIYPIPYSTLDESIQDLGEKKTSDLCKKFIKEKLATQCSKTIYLKQSELVDCSLDSLELLDALGGKWPVISE